MRLPFIDRIAVGLHLTETSIVWAELHSRAGRIVRLHSASEAIGEGEGAAVALARLVERLDPGVRAVVTHLDPLHVRHVRLRGPAFDDEETRSAWVRAQVQQELPAGTGLNDFVIREGRREMGEDHTACLVALARVAAVEARCALLQEAGVQPVAVGSVDAVAGHVLAFDASFAEGHSAVLISRAGEAVLAGYVEGRLQAVLPLTGGAGEPDVLGREVVALLFGSEDSGMPGRPDRLFVLGEQQETVASWLQKQVPDGLPVLAGPVTIGARERISVPASHLLPAALAMRQLFPALEGVDFLDGTAMASWRQEVEKRDALRCLLIAGGLAAFLLVVVTAASAWIGWRQAQASEALAQMAGQVAEVEAARVDLARLEQDVEQAERLVLERTNRAGLLELVGRTAPEQLWLESINVSTPERGDLRVMLSGVAFDERHVAAYLKRLEKGAAAHRVRLVYSESVPARTLYRQLDVRERVLTRFEVALQVGPETGGGRE